MPLFKAHVAIALYAQHTTHPLTKPTQTLLTEDCLGWLFLCP